MKDDPVIDKIREVRKKISEQFNNDPHLLIDHYIELQKQYNDRLITTPKEEEKPITKAS